MNKGRLSEVYPCVALINQVFVIRSFTILHRLMQLCFTQVVLDPGDSCKWIITNLNRVMHWKGRFQSLHLYSVFVLTLASDRTVLNEDVAFSILALSTKKRSSSFLRKVLFFLEICFKFKSIEDIWNFQWFSQKHVDLSNRGLFWKSLVPFFRRT